MVDDLKQPTAVVVDGQFRPAARIVSVAGDVAFLYSPGDAHIFGEGPVEVIVSVGDGTTREQTRRVECRVVDSEKGHIGLLGGPSWCHVFPAICGRDYLVPVPCSPALRSLDDWRAGHDRFFGVDRTVEPHRLSKDADPVAVDEPGRLEPPFACSQVVAWARALRDAGVLEYEAQGVRMVLAPKQIEAPAVTLPKGLELIDIAKARAAKAEEPPEPLTPEQKHDKLFKSVLPKGAPIPPFVGKR